MQIHYCLSCGMQIRADKIKGGEVLVHRGGEGYYCKQCSKDLADELDAVPAEASDGQKPATSAKKRGLSDRFTPASSRRASARPPSKLPVVAIGIGACVLIALAAAFALGRSSGDPAERGTVEVPPALVAELNRLKADDDADLDAWRELQARVVGTPLATEVAAEIARVEKALDARRAERFAAIRREADTLADAGRFDAALSRWDTFDRDLLDTEYRSKIADQRQAIADRQKAAVWNPGTIPVEGTPRPCFLRDHDLDGWRVVGVWSLREGVLRPDRLDTRTHTAVAWPPTGPLGDYHLTFEVKPTRGRIRIAPRIGADAGPAGDRWIVLTGLRPDWNRVHVVVRGDAAEHWVESSAGERVVHPTRRPLPQGAGGLAFRAEKGDAFAIRRLSVRVQRGPAAPAPPQGTPRPLFDGSTLDGWTPSRAGLWKPHAGHFQGINNTNSKAHVTLTTGDESWRDYRLAFEVRDITGSVRVRLRVHGKWYSFFNLIQSEFPTRGRWYPVEFTARANTLTERLPHAERARAFHTGRLEGRIAFNLPRGARADFRNVRLIRYR